LDRALVRVAGAEDHQWLYVTATRAARQTTFFDVVSPEPRPVELELDVPSPQPHGLHEDLVAVGRRDGAKQLAVDTAAPLALRQMSKRQLRAERDRVATLLRNAPPDRSRLLAHATDQRQLAEQGVTEATAREQTARDRVAELGQGTGRLLHRRELAQARDHLALAHTAAQLARQQADRAADRQRQARRAQQQHLAYKERHAGVLAADRARARELAWRHRASLRALSWGGPAGSANSASRPPASRASALGGRPPPTSCSTASATASPTPTTPSGPNPATRIWSSAATLGPPVG
jgi:hypothetical protein